MDTNYQALDPQHLLISMSDDPTRFAQRPFAGLVQQCWDARYGGGSDGMAYLDVPF
jgi:hypothetical protein